tara:strand:+ start:275 stop:751 length:477 start_codon:yes stop_codon:yes gene_type:complete
MAIRPNRKPMKFASGAKDRQQKNAIEAAIADAMRDESETALSFDDVQLLKEMINRKEGLAASMMGMTKPEPRPDVGAILRGNKAARRTAQDLASMKAGGLVGGQVKLDKNKDGKISGADFKMMEDGGEVKGKKRKKSKGNMCRGGGAALRGTKFSGTK